MNKKVFLIVALMAIAMLVTPLAVAKPSEEKNNENDPSSSEVGEAAYPISTLSSTWYGFTWEVNADGKNPYLYQWKTSVDGSGYPMCVGRDTDGLDEWGRGFAEWDLSSIPNNARILDVDLSFYMDYPPNPFGAEKFDRIRCDLEFFEMVYRPSTWGRGNPVGTVGLSLFNDADNGVRYNRYQYVYNDDKWYTVDLGTSADDHVKYLLTHGDWFAVGFHMYGENENGGADEGITMLGGSYCQLKVTYTYSVSYTIATNPSGLQVRVDGTWYTAPRTFSWDVGTTHSIYTSSPQGSYKFSSWSDGGAQSHTITVGSTSRTITANFVLNTVSYTIATNPSGLQVRVDGTWYTAPRTFSWVVGTTHSIYTSSPQGSYTFSSWSDGGAQSHTITVGSTSRTITAYFTTSASSFDIWTDKVSYSVGENMRVYVRVKNPGSALSVRAIIKLQLYNGAFYGPLLDMTTTLPAGFDSGNVLWESFTLPSVPSGTYKWIAELRNPSTNALITSDTWTWTIS